MLCNLDTPKKPAFKHWLKQRPSSAKAVNWIRQGGQLGLIPGSIDSVCLDVDKGNPETLAKNFPPFCRYESRTAGHFHCWYESRQPVQLYLWEFGECSGQVISSTRFVSLPSPNHVSLLLQGMIDNPQSIFPSISLITPTPPYPPTFTNKSQETSDMILVTSDLQDAHYLDNGDMIPLQDTFPPTNPLTTPQNLIGKVDTRRVERASIGERNNALFDTLRFWAYRQPRPSDFWIWEWQCVELALELRDYLPSLQDFPEREARDTARSVAEWTWENPQTAGSVDGARQRKRAFLRAKKARQKAHNRDAEIVVWRDTHGKSWREIAALMGMSAEGCRKAYVRKKAERGNG